GRIRPPTSGIDPGRGGKMMQHHHGYNTGPGQVIKLVDIPRQFGLVQSAIRLGFESGAIGPHSLHVSSHPWPPFDVFPVSMVTVASNLAGASVAGNKMSPFVVDMPFDLCRGSRGSPQKSVGKSQRLSISREVAHESNAAPIKLKI